MDYKLKKKYLISETTKKRIEKDIELLSNLQEGIYHKHKELDIGFHINIIIDKKIVKINVEDNNIPEYITFLIIVDSQYPTSPPKILSKTNFCYPSLMDGRDLFKDIFLNPWTEKSSLQEATVLNSKTNYFFGKYYLGAVYDLKNFGNMLVNTFPCKIVKDINKKNMIENDKSVTLILSDDAFILFENLDSNYGKVCFWSALYGIVDIQIIKEKKIVSINFYSDDTVKINYIKGEEIHLALRMDNNLFFREALVKRMNQLNIKVEHSKMIKGQNLEKKLTDKEIKTMTITDLEKHIEILHKKIDNKELNYYNIKTLINLCQKAVEICSAENNPKFTEYLNLVKNILSREEVENCFK